MSIINQQLHLVTLNNTKRQVQIDKEEAEISSKAAQERTTLHGRVLHYDWSCFTSREIQKEDS